MWERFHLCIIEWVSLFYPSRVSEQQGRPRFMFYYNFPPATDPTTGNMQWGGVRVQYTGEYRVYGRVRERIWCSISGDESWSIESFEAEVGIV